MEKLYEDNYVSIYLIPDIKTIFLDWKDFIVIDDASYQNAFNVAQDYLKNNQTKVENLITEGEKQGPISPTQRKWLEETSLPESVKFGLKRVAVVSSMNVFKKYYLNQISKNASKFQIPLKVFTSKDEAIDWIKSFY